MRNPWLVELIGGGRNVARPFPTKGDAIEALTVALDFEDFEAAILIRRIGKTSSTPVARYFIGESGLEMERLRLRHAPRAHGQVTRRQFSQIVDQAVMDKGFTAREARAVRRAIVDFWLRSLKSGKTALTPFGLLRLDVRRIEPSIRRVDRSSHGAVAHRAEKQQSKPPRVALASQRFKKTFVIEPVPESNNQLYGQLAPSLIPEDSKPERQSGHQKTPERSTDVYRHHPLRPR